MFTSAAQLLGTAATAYGVLAALTTLLQARQMLARGTSCEVSGRFFASYAGGYAIWLVYGLSTGNLPLITVDAVGLLCAGLTLAVALSLRGSLLHPATWTSCTDPRPNPRPAAHGWPHAMPRVRRYLPLAMGLIREHGARRPIRTALSCPVRPRKVPPA
jgi:uncharacterized protein with PQ loop repeat